MEDALLSMESFSVLSGAGLIDASATEPIYVHQTSTVEVKEDNTIELPEGEKACWNKLATTDDLYKDAADIFIMVLDGDEVSDEPCIPVAVDNDGDHSIMTCYSHAGLLPKDSIVLVDYYVKRIGGAQMIEITADKFGGNYYLEASTLFRRESDGVDMPAEFIIPNCKVQSNFTFNLAATGDPSTFTFTMDAFPDYTKFDKTHKVLAAIQVITDESGETEATREPCHSADEDSTQTVSVTSRGANVTTTITDDNTIVVTGTSSGTEYDTATFNTIDTKAVEVDINLPISNEGGTYTVIQTNPILGAEYNTDANVSGNVKTKSYDIPAGEEFTYQFLVSELGGPITIELRDAEGVSLATYVVAIGVSFT